MSLYLNTSDSNNGVRHQRALNPRLSMMMMMMNTDSTANIYPEYLHAEVFEALVRLSGVEQHVDEELGVIHVGDGFVQGIHDEQCMVLERLAGAEVRFVHRTKLLKHRHHVRTRLEHSAARHVTQRQVQGPTARLVR